MSLDLQEQLREYARAVVADSSPAPRPEQATQSSPWPRRAVALAAAGVALIMIAVVLVTRPVTSRAPVIDTPPSVAPSLATDQEIILGAVVEAAEALGTIVREFDFEPGWTASQLEDMSAFKEENGTGVVGPVDLERALVATVNAAFGDEPVVDEEEPVEPPYEAHSDAFSILAFRDASAASLVIATAGGVSLTDASAWTFSEGEPGDYTYPAAIAAAALGDESTYYLDGSRGVGTHLLIRHGRFVFEMSHARVPDVDRVAAAVFAALDSEVVPRVSVAPAAQVPAVRDTGYRMMTAIEIIGDRGTLDGDWMFEAIEGGESAADANFEICSGQDEVAFSILSDDRVVEGHGPDVDGVNDDDLVPPDDPRYLRALTQCRAVPFAVADLGIDLSDQVGAPSVRTAAGPLVARSWRYDLDTDFVRPTGLVGPDATEIGGWLATDGSQTWLLRLHVDFRASARFVSERFALDLSGVADPEAQVLVRIDYTVSDLANGEAG